MESPRHQVPLGQVEFGNEFPVRITLITLGQVHQAEIVIHSL